MDRAADGGHTAPGMRDRHAFAAFLRARREAVAPEQAGLRPTGRRRTPGLRREELAGLAGITPDYLVRLEQGRDVRPSLAVLMALARALRLDAAQREHLLALAGAAAERDDAPADGGPERAGAGTEAVIAAMTGPAFVLGRRMDVLTANPLARALLGLRPGEERNMARETFLREDHARALYPEWEEVADETVSHLRLLAARWPADAALAALLTELELGSAAFRTRWAGHDVREKSGGRKLIRHPELGTLTLRFEVLGVAEAAGQHVVVYLPADAATTERLERLRGLRAVA